MTLEEDIEDLVAEAVCMHSPQDDLAVFRRRLRDFLELVQNAAGADVTVRELLEQLPDEA
jgi:hypothetical protein